MSRRRAFTLVEATVTFALLALLLVLASQGAGIVAKRAAQELVAASFQQVILAEERFAVTYGSYTPYPGDLALPRETAEVTTGPVLASGLVSIAVGEDGTLGLAMFENRTCVLARVSSVEEGAKSEPVEPDADSACDSREALPPGEPAVPVATARR